MRRTVLALTAVLLIAVTFLLGMGYGRQAGSVLAAGSASEVYTCSMHPDYRSHQRGSCPACGMDLVPARQIDAPQARPDSVPLPAGTVTVSAEKQQLIGVVVSEVTEASGAHTLRLTGRVTPDEARVYTLNAGIAGFIRDVGPFTTGSRVSRGQTLATFSAPDAVLAIQNYLVALNAIDRLKEAGGEAAAQAQANSTGAAFQQRLEALLNLGMSADQIEELARTRLVPERLRIVSPADGFILARRVTPGLRFERGAEWYRIADLDKVWVQADVFGHEVEHVRPGMEARLVLPDRGRSIPARASGVVPQFDAGSRTLKVRLLADNPDLLLQPEMFVDVELQVALDAAITVPVDAVVDAGTRTTVFLERQPGVFEPRTVETGWRLGDRVEIRHGLVQGDRIVTSSTFLLDSESRMRMAGTRQPAPATAKDPICAMEVDPAAAKAAGRTSQHGGETYYFCSDACKTTFDQNPHASLKTPHDHRYDPRK